MRKNWLFASMLFGLVASVPLLAQNNFAYVTNGSDNTVSYIDTDVPVQFGTASGPGLGPIPTGIAADPTGTWVYVANQFGNSVTVLSASTPTIVATFSVGMNPVGVDFNPSGSNAYVTLAGANAVAVIDTATRTVTATLPVGAAPIRVTVDPTGSYAYVSNQNSGNISIINLADNSVMNVPVGFIPAGIVFSPDGALAYVNVGGENKMVVIDTASQQIIGTVTGLTGALDSAISPLGDTIYVTSPLASAVFVVDTASLSVVNTITDPPLRDPGGVAFTSDGASVYVANHTGANVAIIDATNQVVTGYIAVGNGPIEIAMSKGQ